MLWNIIRDWFVQYIWGGYDSSGEGFFPFIGHFFDNGHNEIDGSTSTLAFPLNNWYSSEYEVNVGYISIGDWLSTTSTIIVLILMCVFLFLCVRYLFKVGAGLFSNLRG